MKWAQVCSRRLEQSLASDQSYLRLPAPHFASVNSSNSGDDPVGSKAFSLTVVPFWFCPSYELVILFPFSICCKGVSDGKNDSSKALNLEALIPKLTYVILKLFSSSAIQSLELPVRFWELYIAPPKTKQDQTTTTATTKNPSRSIVLT